MCGRYVSVARRAELQELYETTSAGDGKELAPSWNVAPTSKVYAVVERRQQDQPGADRQLRAVRWGLVPSWSKEPKAKIPLHNARADKLATAASWRAAFAKRRAVIPAAGYYEWLPADGPDGKTVKQPYYIHPAHGRVLSFAGLYEIWQDPAKDDDDPGRLLWSATIITSAAKGSAGEMFDRAPVILPADRIDAWLDPGLTDTAAAQKLLTGIEFDPLQMRAVSTAVNKPGPNKAELIQPLQEGADQPLQLALT
jgi:putative SOS response-associated peptidase YedK